MGDSNKAKKSTRPTLVSRLNQKDLDSKTTAELFVMNMRSLADLLQIQETLAKRTDIVVPEKKAKKSTKRAEQEEEQEAQEQVDKKDKKTKKAKKDEEKEAEEEEQDEELGPKYKVSRNELVAFHEAYEAHKSDLNAILEQTKMKKKGERLFMLYNAAGYSKAELTELHDSKKRKADNSDAPAANKVAKTTKDKAEKQVPAKKAAATKKPAKKADTKGSDAEEEQEKGSEKESDKESGSSDSEVEVNIPAKTPAKSKSEEATKKPTTPKTPSAKLGAAKTPSTNTTTPKVATTKTPAASTTKTPASTKTPATTTKSPAKTTTPAPSSKTPLQTKAPVVESSDSGDSDSN